MRKLLITLGVIFSFIALSVVFPAVNITWAVSTNIISLSSTSWTSLGTGPMLLTSTAEAVYVISDSSPASTVGIGYPIPRGPAGFGVVINTNSTVWASLVNGSTFKGSAIVAPINASSGNGPGTTNPLVFPVESYGASTTNSYHTYGDATTSTTGGTTTLTSPSANFSQKDVGDPIQIWYAGTTATILPPAQNVTGTHTTSSSYTTGAVNCYPRGTLVATTYYIRMTYLGSGGETTGSTEYSISCPSGTLPQVYSPLQVYGAQAWNIYISSSASTETLQNVFPLQIGQAFWLQQTGLVAGAALPVSNTTSIVPPNITTIATVTGQHTVTLTNASGTDVINGNYAYGVDQLSSFNAAFTACTNAGGGTVTLGAQYVVWSGTLSIPPMCSLQGPNNVFGNQNSGTNSLPNSTPAIILNPAHSISPGYSSGIANVGVFEFGIPQNNLTTRLGIDAVSNFSGTGIVSSGAGTGGAVQLDRIYEIGFYKCIDDAQAQRWSINHWFGQCNNGILVRGNKDAPATIFDAETIAWYGQNSSWRNTTYTISAVSNSSGSIQLTIPTPNILQAGDFISISAGGGGASNFSGINSRWIVSANDGAGHITLANSQFSPSTTASFASGAQVATLVNMNSVSAHQTIAATGIGPGGTNIILGVNYITNEIYLQYATTSSGTLVAATITNGSYTSAVAQLTIQSGATNGTAYYVADGGGVMFSHINNFGWNTCIWVEQNSTLGNDKVRNIKFSSTVCDDKVDPTEIQFLYDRNQNTLIPGEVQWVNDGVTNGYGQGFVVDTGSSSGAGDTGGVFEVANINISGEPGTQVIGTVLTGRASISNGFFPPGGGSSKDFIKVGQNANGLSLASSISPATYIAQDSSAQTNVFCCDADVSIGGKGFGPPSVVPLTTPLVSNMSGAAPSTAVVQYAPPTGADTGMTSAIYNNTKQPADVVWPVSGNLTQLVVSIPGLSAGGYKVGFVNVSNGLTAAGALECTITAPATSCTDAADSFPVTGGTDKIAIEFCPLGSGITDCNSGSTPTITSTGQIIVSALFTSSSNQGGVLIGGQPTTALSTTLTQWSMLGGILPWESTSEITASSVVPAAGTISNLQIEESGAPTPGTNTFTVMHNGSTSTVTCAASATAQCNDTTHSFTVAVGDTISIQNVPSSTPTARSARVAVQWTPNTAGQAIMLVTSDTVPGTGAGSRFGPLSGSTKWTTTEANEQDAVPNVLNTITLSNLIVAESTAPGTVNTRGLTLGSSLFNPLGPTTSTSLSAVITSSSTLTIGGVSSTPAAQDISDTVASGPGDYVDWYMTTVGTQNAISWFKAGAVVTVP